MKNIYLPGLNALRAIAAIVVLLYHFDICFSIPLGLTSFKIYETNTQASLAVTLFFVLSGYLITYLLLCERDKFKKIHVKAFYIRRCLRIWPLYYLIIFATFLLNVYFLHKNIFATDTNISLLYLFFCGNFVEPFYLSTISNLSVLSPLFVLWSLAVEEQFYLIWPWIIKYSRHLLSVLLAFVGCYLSLKLIVQFTLPQQFVLLLNLTRLDCMAIGAIGAVSIQTSNERVQAIVHKVVFNVFSQIICWVVFLTAFTRPIHIFSFIDSELYSVVFIVVIMNISRNKNSVVRLENKVFNFLGQISYGIYMYHTLLMILLVKTISKLENSFLSYFQWLVIVTLLVIAVAYLSNKYFENYFIKLKKRFEIVHSTNKSKSKKLQIAVAMSNDVESF